MPTILTPAEIKEHLETDLPTAALQRLIDEADALVIERYGPHSGNTTERIHGGGPWLFLAREASALVTVTEIVSDVETVLAADDYRLWYEGAALRRLHDGTNERRTWGEEVEVVYAPKDNQAQRKRVVIDLVALAIRYRALESERAGDYSASHVDYQVERERILAGLNGQWAKRAA